MSFLNIGGNSTLYDAVTTSLARVSSGNHLSVSEPTLVVGGTWDGATLDTLRWTSTILNAATTTVGAGINTMATLTSANASIKVHSNKVGRYFVGAPSLLIAEVKLGDTGTANNIRRWGVFDDNNGAFFQLSGTTFGVVTRKATSDTVVTSLSGTAFTMDTNYHVYEIMFVENKVIFIIDKILRHTATFSTTLWTDTMHLKIGYENTNSGGSTSNVNIVSRAAALYRFGKPQTRPSSANITTATTTTLKSGPGTLHRLVICDASTSTSTATIYDNTAGSGTVLGIVDLTNAVGNVFDFDIDFSIGLTVVTTATMGNLTVVYD